MHTYFAHSYSLITFIESLDNNFDTEQFFSYLPLCHVPERMVIEYTGVFCGGTIFFLNRWKLFLQTWRIHNLLCF